ncbi:MAG TPA: CehA/McbA family metallohydrolase [Candidatus Binatia bacterium]
MPILSSRRASFTPVLLVALSLLLAAPADAVLDKPQQACQSEVAKQGRTFFRSVSRALRKCKDRIARGALPPGADCTIESRTANAISRARSRVAPAIARRCTDPVVTGLVFGDACYGSTSVGELASCQVEVHEEQALRLIDTLFDAMGAVNGAQRECQKTAAVQAERFAFRKHDLLRQCKDKVAKGKLPADTDCDAQTNAQLAKVRAAAAAKIAAKCSDATVASMAFATPCTGVTTSNQLVGCLLGSHDDGVDRLLVAEYGRGPGGAAIVKQITDDSECVKGPLSRCRVGDYLLANDKIRVVVQSPQRNLLNVGQFGGQIIDADLVRTPGDPDRDNFEEWATAINIENTAHYTDLTIINDGSNGQPAILRATGVDDLLDFVNPSSVVADFGFPFPVSANDTDLPVEIVTDYVLEPGRNWVRVDTTVQNVSGSGFNIFFGEYIGGSGQIETFQPGYGFGEPLVAASCPVNATNPCNVIAYGGFGEGTGVSYGYVHDVPGSSSFSTAGVTVPLLGIETVFALIGVAGQNFPLAALGNPGDSITFTRYFVVGDGSVSSIFDARNEFQYIATGTIEGTVLAGGSPMAGVRVSVLGNPAEGPGLALGAPLTRNVVTQAVTDELGRYSLTVPPGNYNVVAALDGWPYQGGGSSPAQNPVTVVPYQTSTVDLALPATGTLHVNVIDENGDPIAAKVSVVGFDPSPNFVNTQSILGLINNRTGVFRDVGEDGLPFGLTQVAFVGPDGDSGPLALEPGTYQIVASHGPEYSISSAIVNVVASSTTSETLQIARVIDSSGFISADFHVHSIDSPDGKVTKIERVVSMLAEGVDFFTPSDHESRQDFEPTIAALGVSDLISVAPAGEITTFDYGHFNAWPMTIDPSLVNGGSVDHGGAAPPGQDFPQYGNYSLTPAEIIAAAHADPGPDTVHINHIHSFFGLEGNSGLAIDTGMEPPQSMVPGSVRRLDPSVTNYFTDTFDALEIWIESGRAQVFESFYGRNLGDWINLLNQGIIGTGVANSDTHKRISGQSGSPRTYVASPTDDPGQLRHIAETLSGNVNDGRAFGSNAPFVRFTAYAASTGELGGLELGLPTMIRTTDGAVDVTLEIQSPVWAEFDRIEIYVNSATTRSVEQRQSGVGLVDVASYTVTPDYVLEAGVDFTVSTVNVVPAIPTAQRLEATATLSLTGLTQDAWILAVVRGTDGVSRPLFPVIPNDLRSSGNATLADLMDGNLGENGLLAMAFTNPLFVDVDGGGWTPPGVQLTP